MRDENRFLKKIAKRCEKLPPLCVGLDGDISKLADVYSKDLDGMRKFLFDVIEVTCDYTVCYKPNAAFFECLGYEGIKMLKEVIEKIPEEIAVITDAKRGDIGNTSKKYAEFVFDDLNSDAVTLAPYMGSDSVEPFLERKDRFAFILALTSNPGADDFEKLVLPDGKMVFEKVLEKIDYWNTKYSNAGAVVGATRPQELLKIRECYNNLTFLIPGVGTQGGDLETALKTHNPAQNSFSLINYSRAVLYPNLGAHDKDVKKAINKNVIEIVKQMESFYG